MLLDACVVGCLCCWIWKTLRLLLCAHASMLCHVYTRHMLPTTPAEFALGQQNNHEQQAAPAGALYAHPAMSFDEAKHEEVMAEARKWKQIFDTGKYDASVRWA